MENSTFDKIEMQESISEEMVFKILEISLHFKSKETIDHTKRTSKYAKVLVHKMLKSEKYKRDLIQMNYESIINVMTIHDIGKIGIGDDILFNLKRLSDKEFDKVKSHITVGLDILDFSLFASKNAHTLAFKNCQDIIKYHHERWDGSGYLEGLRGEQIPLSARIAAIADVYDALTSERSYKKAFSHMETVQFIRRGAGSHFDPGIVNCFLDIAQDFKMIFDNSNKELNTINLGG